MLTALKVLIVEDSEDDALLLLRTLRKSGYEPALRRVQTAEEMTRALLDGGWDVILCDYHLPGFSAPEAIALVKMMALDIPLIVVSGAIGEETAMECIHLGATDYIMKSNLARLGLAVARELEKKDMRGRQKQTESQRAEAIEALRLSEEKFRTIADYTVNWESWFAPDGMCLWVNPAVERITGYSADEVMAMPDFVSVIIDEQDRGSFRNYFQNALKGTRGDNFEIRCRHKNGGQFWLSVAWQPVYDASGRYRGIRTSGRDVTAVKSAEGERRELERKLYQAQKMEALGTLAGGIAHDFNNILSGIIGYAELAAMQPDAASRKRNIGQILNAAERARNLIRQILAFSRHVELEKKPMDFNLVAKDALKLLRATIPATIEMRQELAEKPLVIYADYTQMHQVIMNICTNALQAMGEKGGTLSVRVSSEEVPAGFFQADAERPPGRYALISITDTGCGIDAAHLGRLFDPFFTTKKPGEGTGLGLAVVYGIVQDHGGAVLVQSKQGHGSTFDVYLPVLETSGLQAEVEDTAELPHGQGNILLVDDEKDVGDIGRVILTSLGYQVRVCSDSREALKLFLENPGAFDLVITDMNMPFMSGAELSRLILAEKPDQAIVLCTGYSDYMDADRAAKLGIRAFALKPLTKRKLALLVRNVLCA